MKMPLFSNVFSMHVNEHNDYNYYTPEPSQKRTNITNIKYHKLRHTLKKIMLSLIALAVQWPTSENPFVVGDILVMNVLKFPFIVLIVIFLFYVGLHTDLEFRGVRKLFG